MQENHQADAHTRRDHSSLDFVITFDFGREAPRSFDLQFATFMRVPGKKHLRNPGVAPVELLPECFGVYNLANGVQVRTAKIAELKVLTLIGATSRTEHE